jgi:Ca2+/Na+ antiporter
METVVSAHAVTNGRAMSVVYFTIVAIILYFAADWLLERVEVVAGRRLEHRSLIFFVILLTLALTSLRRTHTTHAAGAR